MTPRLSPNAVVPEAYQAMLNLEGYVRSCGLEPSLLHLVKVRASQINGCAFCIHMHTREARASGEREERLYLLDGWRESPLYSARERAALGWTEALTLIAETHAPDDAYQALKENFSEEEEVKLSLAITTINAWNRLSIGFRVIHPVAAEHEAA